MFRGLGFGGFRVYEGFMLWLCGLTLCRRNYHEETTLPLGLQNHLLVQTSLQGGVLKIQQVWSSHMIFM